MKKYLSFVITAVFAISLLPATAQAFEDVSPGDSYYPAVDWLEFAGAIRSGRFFNPDQPLSKAAFLKILIDSSSLQVDTDLPSSVPDVPNGSWFAPYVSLALQYHLMDLDPDGLFHPDRTINRAEAFRAGMIAFGIGVPLSVPQTLTLPDVRRDTWYAPYIYRGEELGLIPDNPGNTTQPLKKLTRSEGAELIYRLHLIATQTPSSNSRSVPIVNIEFEPVSSVDDGRIELMLHVWQLLENRYLYPDSVNDEDLGYGAIDGMVEALDDPYTEFFPPSQTEGFTQSLENEVVGIGSHVVMEDGRLIITAPVPGSPSDRAGLQPRDIITRVDDVDIAGMNKMDAVNLIRGEEGTPVKITILRPSDGRVLDFNIIRELIDPATVTFEIKDRNYALVRISQFTGDTPNEFIDVVNTIKSRGSQIRGIVLDLRNNPGGYLDGALRIASFFLKRGETITSTQDRYGNGQEYTAASDGDLFGYNTVILVNEGSASASEILAGALSKNNHAKVVGSQSFGKGTAQLIHEFPDGSLLKMTTAEWLLPDGSTINHSGITPDIEISNDLDTHLDEQLSRALNELRR